MLLSFKAIFWGNGCNKFHTSEPNKIWMNFVLVCTKGRDVFSCSMLFLAFTSQKKWLIEPVMQWKLKSQICHGQCATLFLPLSFVAITVHVMSNEDYSLDCYRIILAPYALAIFHTHASSQDTYTCRIWITSDASGCDSSTALIRLSALWEVPQRKAEHIL